LVDVHLYLKDELKAIKEQVKTLFDLLMESAEKHQNVLLPGYTHLQIANAIVIRNVVFGLC
jgi:argininosuccinate lyase